MTLGLLSLQQLLSLGHDLGLEEARAGAEGADDCDVEAPGAEGGVGDVDDLVAGRVQGGASGTGSDRLAGADLAGDHAQRRLLDAVEDAGDGLLMRDAGEELRRCQRFGEGGSDESEVSEPGRLDGHQVCSSSVVRSRKEIEPVSLASCSARTWPRESTPVGWGTGRGGAGSWGWTWRSTTMGMAKPN